MVQASPGGDIMLRAGMDSVTISAAPNTIRIAPGGFFSNFSYVSGVAVVDMRPRAPENQTQQPSNVAVGELEGREQQQIASEILPLPGGLAALDAPSPLAALQSPPTAPETPLPLLQATGLLGAERLIELDMGNAYGSASALDAPAPPAPGNNAPNAPDAAPTPAPVQPETPAPAPTTATAAPLDPDGTPAPAENAEQDAPAAAPEKQGGEGADAPAAAPQGKNDGKGQDVPDDKQGSAPEQEGEGQADDDKTPERRKETAKKQ